MKLGRTLVLLSIGLEVAVYAAPPLSCIRVLVDSADTRASQKAYWDRVEPITMNTTQGPQAFAFGWDAELWHVEDILRVVSADKAAMKAARSLLQERAAYTPDKLKEMLGLGARESLAPHLKQSAEGPKYTLLDVKLPSLSRLEHKAGLKSRYALMLETQVQASLRNRQTGASVKLEESSGARSQGSMGGGSAIELIMDGAKTSPSDFRDNIKNILYKDTKHPETHFHLSIPTAVATPKQVMLAARAAEMKIILEEAVAEIESDGTMYPYDDSVIAQNIQNWGPSNHPFLERGAVRVTGSRWSSPYPAHDVEFRQWLDADNALDNMRFMMELIQKAPYLRDTSNFTGKYVQSQTPANIGNSLKYAALVLKDRLPEERRYIAEKLEAYGQEVSRRGAPTADKRKEIGRFLKHEQVLKYITLETFLEPH